MSESCKTPRLSSAGSGEMRAFEIILALHLVQARGGAAEFLGVIARGAEFIGRRCRGTDELHAMLVELVYEVVED